MSSLEELDARIALACGIGKKTCKVCDKKKDLSEFSKESYGYDGYRSTCRSCVKILGVRRRESSGLTSRKCSKCGETKNITEFFSQSSNKDGYQKWCKKCACNKSTSAERLRSTGWTQEEYDIALESQGGMCAICHKAEPDGRQLAADHNHSTMNKRGLLCLNCNQGIGKFKDDPDLLQAAIDYLRTHNTEGAAVSCQLT